jgi:hypothetical protein
MTQFSDEILNTYFAPRLSELTVCGAPDVAPLENYSLVLALNETLGPSRYKDPKARILLGVFIRRLDVAIREYRSGRDALATYVAALPHRHELASFTRALSHFENCVLQLHVSLLALRRAVPRLNGGSPLPPATDDYDRVRRANNRVKHFDEDVRDSGTGPVPVTAIWITDTGLEFQPLGETSVTCLPFAELAAIFEAQRMDAKTFASEWLSQPGGSAEQRGGG